MKVTHKNLDRLGRDLKRMAGDLESLLKGLPEDLSDEAGAARKRISNTLESVGDLYQRVERQARAGVEATDEYIHDNPWPFIGAAIGVGLLAGALLCWKSTRS